MCLRKTKSTKAEKVRDWENAKISNFSAAHEPKLIFALSPNRWQTRDFSNSFISFHTLYAREKKIHHNNRRS